MEFLKTLKIGKENKGVSTGIQWLDSKGEVYTSYSPVDGKVIGTVKSADRETYEAVIKKSEESFKLWRLVHAQKL